MRQVAEDRIIFQKVSEGFGVGEIVYGHDIDVFVVECSTKDVATNTSKAVNANFHSHVASEEKV